MKEWIRGKVKGWNRGDSRYWSSRAFPRTESIIGGREPLVSWHGDRISRLLSVVGTLLDNSAIVYPRISPFLPHRGNGRSGGGQRSRRQVKKSPRLSLILSSLAPKAQLVRGTVYLGGVCCRVRSSRWHAC